MENLEQKTVKELGVMLADIAVKVAEHIKQAVEALPDDATFQQVGSLTDELETTLEALEDEGNLIAVELSKREEK